MKDKDLSLVKKSLSMLRLVYALIIIGLMMAGGYLCFYLMNANRALAKQVQLVSQQITQLTKDQAAEKNALSQQINQAKEQQISVIKQLQTLSGAMKAMNQTSAYDDDDWLLFQSRYYLELAAINAKWSHDKEKTTELLQQADSLLASMFDPRILEIRHTLGMEIAEQETKKNLDVINLLNQLLIVNQRLDGLLTINKPVSMQKTTVSLNWKSLFEESLQSLKQLVVIQPRLQADSPILSQTQLRFKLASIRLYLQQAQWSVVQYQYESYQMALQEAIKQLATFKTIDSNLVTQLTQRLQGLASIAWPSGEPLKNQALIQLNQLIETKPSKNHD